MQLDQLNQSFSLLESFHLLWGADGGWLCCCCLWFEAAPGLDGVGAARANMGQFRVGRRELAVIPTPTALAATRPLDAHHGPARRVPRQTQGSVAIRRHLLR